MNLKEIKKRMPKGWFRRFTDIQRFWMNYYSLPGPKCIVVASIEEKKRWIQDIKEREVWTDVPIIYTLEERRAIGLRVRYCFLIFPLEILEDDRICNFFYRMVGTMIGCKICYVEFAEASK